LSLFFLQLLPAEFQNSDENQSDEKQNPPVSSGGPGKLILLVPYPHHSGHMQQHGAPALKGQNM
jgi:hypothetical protein